MMEAPPVSFQDAPSDRPVPSASSLLLPPAFVQDPTAYLSKVASSPSSREGLAQLAGSVATWFQSSTSADTAPQFASIYLQAAALQLQYDDSATILAGTRIEETEMLLTQQKYEIIEVRTNSLDGLLNSICFFRLLFRYSRIYLPFPCF